MGLETILHQFDEGVARLTFNRAKNMNSINATMHDEVLAVLEEDGRDPSVRVLLVTGAGDRAFCAGLDLNARGDESPMDPARVATRNVYPERALIGAFAAFEKPVIAAVNGVAAGGGLGIALTADVILAADAARFGTAHVHLGLPVLDSIGYFLPRRVGPGVAAEMAFTGRLLGAEEALRIGLVDRVTSLGDLAAASFSLAASIARAAPLSLQLSKQALRRFGGESYPDYARYERYLFNATYRSEDAKEALRARREKRKPKFRGW